MASTSSSWAATPSCTPAGADQRRVIGVLSRGRGVADHLRRLIVTDAASMLHAQAMVGTILDSFTQSLSILCASGEFDREVSQVPAVLNSPPWKSEDSGDSCKAPAPKQRRGCYKRRRTSDAMTKEATALFEDGHAWRKYGQKVILNSKHPRNYFRCTHKYDQGCKATKQVQQIRDDPPLFRTTCHGHHSCRNHQLKSDQIILNDATVEDQDSSIIWSFQSRESTKPLDAAMKRENSTNILKGLGSSNYQMFEPSPDGGYFSMSPESTNLLDTTSSHLVTLSSGTGSDIQGDVISSDIYSCTASTHSMDMDMMVGSVFQDLPDF